MPVNDPRDVHIGLDQQFLRSRKASVYFNQLQLTVARIALELNVAQAAEADAAKETLTHLGGLRQPLSCVIRAEAKVWWRATNDAFGKMEEMLSVRRDVGVVTA